MNNLAKYLSNKFEVWEREGRITTTQLMRRLNCARNTITNALRGNSLPEPELTVKLAKSLELDFEKALYYRSQDELERKRQKHQRKYLDSDSDKTSLIPVITLDQLKSISWKNGESEEGELRAFGSSLCCEGDIAPEEWQPVRLNLHKRKGVAIRVEGKSMIDEFMPGQVIWVDFDQRPMPGEYCVIEFWGKESGQIRSREARIKRVFLWGTESITLESVNPDPKYLEHLVIPNNDIIRIGKVVSKDY